MRLRSTGLGRTELEADIIDIRKVDDLVIFFVNTTNPVKWRTRMGFQERDLERPDFRAPEAEEPYVHHQSALLQIGWHPDER